jgi:hypothetical protein
MANRRKFWRPRFSLRTLVIFKTLAAVVTGWLTQSVLRQRGCRGVNESRRRCRLRTENHPESSSWSWCPHWVFDRMGMDFVADAIHVEFGLSDSFTRGPTPPAIRVVPSPYSQQRLKKSCECMNIHCVTDYGCFTTCLTRRLDETFYPQAQRDDFSAF